MTTTAPSRRVRIDLTYAVEPLAKLLYHAGVCGEQNARALPQPTEDDTAKVFSDFFAPEKQEIYRELAKTALNAARAQLDEAVTDAAKRKADEDMVGRLRSLEDLYRRRAEAHSSRWRFWRQPVVRFMESAADWVRDIRLELERPK